MLKKIISVCGILILLFSMLLATLLPIFAKDEIKIVWTNKEVTSIDTEALIASKELKEIWVTSIEPKEQNFNKEEKRWTWAILMSNLFDILITLTNEDNKNTGKIINQVTKKPLELVRFSSIPNVNHQVFDFQDINWLSDENKKIVNNLAVDGFMVGFSNTDFWSKSIMTREQLVTVLARMLYYIDNGKFHTTDEKFSPYDYLLEKKIINRDDRKTWHLKDEITRGTILIVLHRVYKNYKLKFTAENQVMSGVKLVWATWEEQAVIDETKMNTLMKVISNINEI